MKKNLLLVFVLISTFGFSQVTLRKTTKTATTHLEETMNCANGTNSYTISGSTNIHLGNSDSWGSVLGLVLPNGTFLDNVTGGQINATSQNNITIGGLNISWFPNSIFIREREVINNQNITLKILHKVAYSDINNDYPNNTFGIDSKYESFYIYETQNIPINSTLIISTSKLRDGASSSICYAQGDCSGKTFYLKWTGTEWEHTTTLPNNIPDTQPILQEWVTNALGISEIENSNNKIAIYPNPTNNFITIQNQEKATENFEYKIVDLTGRIVKNGNSKFNEQINIEGLTSGNYIIQMETEKGEKMSEKLVKN